MTCPTVRFALRGRLHTQGFPKASRGLPEGFLWGRPYSGCSSELTGGDSRSNLEEVLADEAVADLAAALLPENCLTSL